MPKLFKDDGTEDVYRGNSSKKARRVCPQELWEKARMRMDALIEGSSIHELGKIPGLRLRQLSGNRSDQYRAEINDQYRICFIWTEEGAMCIEIVDYHR